MSLPPAIHVDSAHLSYNGQAIFDDLSLTIDAGYWTGLLGPSGVGKTSLLRAIAGLLAKDGDVSCQVRCQDGKSLTGRVAYMAQRDLLLPWMSILDNVLLGRRLRTGRVTSQEKGKGAALLEAVGLGDRLDALPGTLSGGMRQRVALARTLAEDRPIVLMDEPFCALDAVTRMRLQDLAVALLDGRTVFLVTHDPIEALRLCDRILLLTGAPAQIAPFLDVPDLPRPRPASDPAMAAAAGAIFDGLVGA